MGGSCGLPRRAGQLVRAKFIRAIKLVCSFLSDALSISRLLQEGLSLVETCAPDTGFNEPSLRIFLWPVLDRVVPIISSCTRREHTSATLGCKPSLRMRIHFADSSTFCQSTVLTAHFQFAASWCCATYIFLHML